MRVGTKSILFGAHQFAWHPLVLFVAWWKLFGFPSDPRLWVAFAVHDLGYWGKPNMDGPEGETHVEFGAKLMTRLFGNEWGALCLFHSRFYAKRYGASFSRLCVADKLAIALEPWWLYLPRVWLTGELWEYLSLAGGRNLSKYKGEPNDKYISMKLATGSIRDWHSAMAQYCRQWAYTHRDMRPDTWTPAPTK